MSTLEEFELALEKELGFLKFNGKRLNLSHDKYRTNTKSLENHAWSIITVIEDFDMERSVNNGIFCPYKYKDNMSYRYYRSIENPNEYINSSLRLDTIACLILGNAEYSSIGDAVTVDCTKFNSIDELKKHIEKELKGIEYCLADRKLKELDYEEEMERNEREKSRLISILSESGYYAESDIEDWSIEELRRHVNNL